MGMVFSLPGTWPWKEDGLLKWLDEKKDVLEQLGPHRGHFLS